MLKFIGEKHQLSGKTLLLPAISVGDIPTKALDHIIAGNGFKRVAFFDTPYLEPSVGYLRDDIENGALGMPAELYLLDDVLILQFRAFVRFARKKDLCKEIDQFCKQYAILQTILISTLPEDSRPDLQIQAKQKNIYLHVKGTVKQLENTDKTYFKGLEALKDNEEEDREILALGGITNALVKQMDNLAAFLLFCKQFEEDYTAIYYAKMVSRILERKELSKTK